MKNSIVLSEKDFQNIDGKRYIPIRDIARHLGYAHPRKLWSLYKRNEDELKQYSGVTKMGTPGGVQSVLCLNLFGAYTIAMFAHTERAKDYRRELAAHLVALDEGEVATVSKSLMEKVKQDYREAREDSLYWRTRFLRSDVENTVRKTKNLNFGVAKIIDRMAERGFSVGEIASLTDLRIESVRGYLHASLRAVASERELKSLAPHAANRARREYGDLLLANESTCAKELYDGTL